MLVDWNLLQVETFSTNSFLYFINRYVPKDIVDKVWIFFSFPFFVF